MIDFSTIGKALVVYKNVRERLMSNVPPAVAKFDERTPTEGNTNNARLVRVYLYPREREVVFDSIRAKNCRLIPAVFSDKEGIFVASPDWATGEVDTMPVDIVLPTAYYSDEPESVAFFIKPKEAIKATEITVHSPYLFLTTSCRLQM